MAALAIPSRDIALSLAYSAVHVAISSACPKFLLGCIFSALAPWALEGSLASVLPEVVTEVAALLENAAAPFELAFEVQFESLSLLVLHLDGFVPVVWNARKSL